MTILELFNNVDKNELAKAIIKQHPYHFSKSDNFEENINNTLKVLDIFYNDILSIVPYTKNDKEMEEFLDFVVVITNYYDDNNYDGVDVYDLDRTNFDIQKLDINKCDKFYCVDGIHLSQLKKNYKCLDLSMEELKQIDDFENNTIINYGLDFLTRKILLSLTIAQPCLDRYNEVVVAAEIFWEMTFYGLVEEQIQKESHKLDESVKEIENGNAELVSLDELFEEDEDGTEYHISKEEIDFGIAFSYKVNEYNHDIKNNMLKEIFEWVKEENL